MIKRLLILLFFVGTVVLKTQAQSFFMFTYPAGASAVLDTINVQVWDSLGHSNGNIAIGKYNNSAWNNWAPAPGVTASLTSAPLKKSTGVATTIQVSVNQINDYVNNGGSWGSTNTMGYPQQIFNVSVFNNASMVFTFSNVSAGTYKVEIVSSTNQGSGPFSQNFTSGSASQNGVNAFNNLATLVSLDNLSPTSGNIAITITPSNSFSVLNAIRLIKKS